MRAIIRFSVDGSPWLRGNLAGLLEGQGFEGYKLHGKTATWEKDGISESDLHQVVAEFWRRVVAFPIDRPNDVGRLDHFWMYADMDDIRSSANRGDAGLSTPALESD